MQSGTRSNTENLEFDPEGAPPGLIEVQNRAVIRNNRRAPPISASDFLDNRGASRQSQSKYSIAHNSEKIDLINILECLARSKPSEDPTIVESVYAVPDVAHLDSGTFAKVELGEEKLCTHLAEKYTSLRATTNAFISAMDGAQAWPSLPLPLTGKRVRSRASHKEDEDEDELGEDELTGLDAQLSNASRAGETSRVSAATSATGEQQGSLCDAVKSYNVSNTSGKLTWQQNYAVETDTPVLQEQFRTPAEAVRQLVSDRMFLLDDHSLEVKLGKRSGASGRTISQTSKDRLIKQAADRLDVTGIVRNIGDSRAETELVTSLKEQALNRALARHTEAVVDAALEMVFQHLAPSAGGSISSNPQKRQSEKPTGPSKKKPKTSDTSKSHTMGSEPEMDVQNASTAELFTWEDIMRCLHAKAGTNGSVQRCDAQIVVHQDLPSLHLNTSVLDRTERRLRALYRGETDAHSLRAVPTIFDYSTINARAALPTPTKAAAGVTAGKAARVEVTLEQEKLTRTRSRLSVKTEPPTAGAAELSTVRIKEKVAGKLIQPHVPIAVWDN